MEGAFLSANKYFKEAERKGKEIFTEASEALGASLSSP